MTHTTEWVEGGAPGLSAARLNEPFHVRAAAFDSVNNRINVTIGPGRAAFLGTVVERLADSLHHIAAPVVNTTYHVYLHSNNTFSHNTTGIELAGAVRLGTVRTGAALADPMTRVDVRGQLPGAATRVHVDATTAHGSVGTVVGVDSSITIDPVPAPTGNVGGLRALLGWLANRIRAITGATNWWDAPATTLATAHTHHTAVAPVHGSTAAATANTMMQRDAAARSQVADGVAAGDIATRGQVDTRAPLRLAINAQTASYTLVLADGDGRLVTMDAASALTLTVPTNAAAPFPIGTQVLIQQLGAGQVTIAAATGVVLQSAGTRLRFREQFAVAGLIKRLSDTWAVVGNVVA